MDRQNISSVMYDKIHEIMKFISLFAGMFGLEMLIFTTYGDLFSKQSDSNYWCFIIMTVGLVMTIFNLIFDVHLIQENLSHMRYFNDHQRLHDQLDDMNQQLKQINNNLSSIER